jgi:CheY-like chemotaxis protein
MPGMDGLQASRHIKSDETLSKQPAIVLVTAFGREEVREEAERLGPRRLPRQAGHQVHARGHARQCVRGAG